jgi:hypothetical protein
VVAAEAARIAVSVPALVVAGSAAARVVVALAPPRAGPGVIPAFALLALAAVAVLPRAVLLARAPEVPRRRG